MKKNKGYRDQSEIPMAMRAEQALSKAVTKVIADHKMAGDPIVIWRDERVTVIPADQIEIREPPSEYRVPRNKKGD